MQKIISHLMSPITIIPIVFFRVIFGTIMMWEVWRYFHYNRVARYFIEPSYYFHYFGFEWVKPLVGDAMNWLFLGLAVLAFMITIGLFYRVAIVIFWLMFTYVFLLDQTQYLNHFYLVALISFLMIFIPAHRWWSVDALIRPSLRSQVIPNWSLWALRGQMAIIYIYGGIAKINPDWLNGEPMRAWLANRTHFPVIGHLFTEEWMVYLFSYGGLLFDLLVVPLLLWHKTRIPTLLVALAFHLTNNELFNIGIFPWFAMGMTLLFLPPDWFRLRFRTASKAPTPIDLTHLQKLGLAGLAIYFTIQILLPLRHFVYPGYVSWTEDGHTLAWHMKLRSKNSGIRFIASNPASGAIWQIKLETYLNDRQISKMTDNPEMILRFSHYLGERLTDKFQSPIQIKVWSMVALNHRATQLFIDPTIDLTQETDRLGTSDWVLPLIQPPAPHTGNPALLISQPNDDVMLLINMTALPFSLDTLLSSTTRDTEINTLDRRDCVLIYRDNDAMQTTFPACDVQAYISTSTPLDTIQQDIINQANDSQCNARNCIVIAKP